ncbi:TfoX/Sxy family protein [Spirillospora sp. CA-128828]|uniref:TfoX/Sxy family protein n=1 Tax=Spirillospora sp. CA-128828 TaxID=3240033 RepID=UPI003D945F64
MTYDRELAEHVRELVGDRPDVTERRMFGGLAWLVNGNMAIVARGQGGLMLRLDPADHENALNLPGAEPTIMRGREMRGWIGVARPGPDLATWVDRGIGYASTLPPK